MRVIDTPISGVFEAWTEIYRDQRGTFSRLFCQEELLAANGTRPIVQINHSRTSAVGAIRGLHFQYPPVTETKWVRCVKGRVFDVAVDLRSGSATFLAWHAVVLDAQHMNAIFIPEGCAHGFQVLLPESELIYLHSKPYSPRHEGGLRFDDPRLAIGWPLPITDISERDRNHPLIDTSFVGISI